MRPDDSVTTDSHPDQSNRRGAHAICLLGVLLLFPLVAGCRGCMQSVPAPAVFPSKKLQSKNLDIEEPQSLPAARGLVGLAMKPGHWYQANQKMTAKEHEEILVANATIYGPDRRPIAMHSGFGSSVFKRELDLATKQSKNIRFQFLQPESDERMGDDAQNSPSGTTPYLNIQLVDRASGAEVHRDEFPIRFLAGYQYNIINLSRDPTRFHFWQGLPCMVWPSRAQNARVMPHRLVDLKVDDVAGFFPNRLFALTSTSHLVLNDVNPDIFARDQQVALLDWLHFGGTIVLNGPEAIVELEASFLRPYLPLSQSSTVDWTEEESATLNRVWTIGEPDAPPKQFTAERDLFMLVGQLHSDADWVPNLEGLVAERSVGRGRVVMTTFPMSSVSFLKWPSYDSLIHNGILRKPPRRVTKSIEPEMVFAKEHFGEEQNPKHSTRLRLWTRDLDSSTEVAEVRSSQPVTASQAIAPTSHSSKRTSYGAWNSGSTVAQTAKASLRAESGISVPKTGTILYLLGGYLICLVPVNWLVFRLMGRVELAWLAAPVIAVVGAGIVARSTQLDIGFSRSQNTYEVLEMHPGHSRGLLSSYHSLYTSLSTTYQATFNEDRGVVTPLFTARDQNSQRRRLSEQVLEYTYGNPTNNGIQNNSVLSNTTGMLHAEETVELGGEYSAAFDFENQQLLIRNALAFPLLDLGVIGLSDENQLQTAWIGSLEPGEELTVPLASGSEVVRWLPQWDANPNLCKPDFVRTDGILWRTQFDGEQERPELYQGAMLNLLASKYPLERGEFIGLGRIEHSVGSIQITPVANQTRRASLLLMHFRSGTLSDSVVPDESLFPIKIEKNNENGDDFEQMDAPKT